MVRDMQSFHIEVAWRMLRSEEVAIQKLVSVIAILGVILVSVVSSKPLQKLLVSDLLTTCNPRFQTKIEP
jgi:hypothetical protein